MKYLYCIRDTWMDTVKLYEVEAESQDVANNIFAQKCFPLMSDMTYDRLINMVDDDIYFTSFGPTKSEIITLNE